MSKQSSFIVTVVLAFTFLLHTPTNALSFPDVKDNKELVNVVDYLSSVGIINGYPDGTYRPNTLWFGKNKGELAWTIPHSVHLYLIYRIRNPVLQ